MNLEQRYRDRHNRLLGPIAQRLEEHLKDCLSSAERIDRIATRAKSVERFLLKAAKLEGGQPKYSDPLSQIQDQIGARIVTFYRHDVDRVAAEVNRFFRAIENKQILPETENEFGYSGEHFILLIPRDVLVGIEDSDDGMEFFELQIKTLFQHAWAEAEHDIGYKPTTLLSTLHRRKMAFTAAQAWGADQIFEELAQELGHGIPDLHRKC